MNGIRVFPLKVLDLLATALLVAAVAFFFGGLLALAFQAQFWFDHGIWKPITVFAGVYGFLPPTFLHWIFDPADGLSVARALQHCLFLSLWWVLMLLSVAILYGALTIDKVSHRRQLRYYRMRRNQLEDESEGDRSCET